MVVSRSRLISFLTKLLWVESVDLVRESSVVHSQFHGVIFPNFEEETADHGLINY